MSRRHPSSAPRAPSSASAPYSRRTSGQPKSTRQQFSACGACRMRRVRCDLKDFCPTSAANNLQQPSCSNCRERNIRCVDEFAEVKAVKLLRRGRRLQQVEARYGKLTDQASAPPSVLQEPALPAAAAINDRSCIPQMQLPFLRSSFFRRFCVQRPIIEPGEFTARYTAHMEGTTPLKIEGKMLAMLLVTWAASFGVDEFGCEDAEDGASQTHENFDTVLDGGDTSDPRRHARLLRTETMTRELIALVDLHGLLRRPSWDGVRVLLLLLPLTHGIQSPLEHLTTYEATLSQVYSLCNFNNPPPVDSGLGPYCDILIRARVFWYAHLHEGISTGLSGGRLVMDDDALVFFQNTLPPQYCASATHSLTPADSCASPRSSSSPGPSTPTFPFATPPESSHPRATLAYLVTTQYFSLALAVSRACRAIHSTLTGLHARRRTESGVAIRKEAMMEIWDELERCWANFEALRRNPSGVGAAGGDIFRGEDVERFVSGWQVFIFACLNVIREALPAQTGTSHPTSDQAVVASLHRSALKRCQKFLPRVIRMLQRHLKVPSSFFAYDTGLIRDGCFFAGMLLAQSDQLNTENDGTGWDADWEEGVAACLQALGEVRWVYSRSREQETILKAEWEARIERDASRLQSPRSFPIKQSPGHSPCLNDDMPLPSSTTLISKPRTLSLVAAGGQVRPHLSPLSVSFPHDDSGPDTTPTDGSGSWEPYTPPSTSGSITMAKHRSLSPISSPYHPIIGSTSGAMKVKGSIFGDDSDDEYPFTVEGTPDSRSSVGSGVRTRWTPFGGNYLDPRVILATSDAVLGACDDGFPPLGSNRHSYLS